MELQERIMNRNSIPQILQNNAYQFIRSMINQRESISIDLQLTKEAFPYYRR